MNIWQSCSRAGVHCRVERWTC